MTPFQRAGSFVSARFRNRSVAGNAAIVAAAFAASRVLGMVREIVVAAQFGTGETYDAYIAAFRIPDMLFVLVMSGAFGSAFIPVFGGFLAREESERAWRLANALLTYTVIVLAVVAQVILFFAEPLVTRLVAPELSPEGQDLAVNLTWLLLLSPLLLGLGAAAKGMLEAQDNFAIPAVAPIVYNLGIMVGAIALAPAMGAYGLAAGVILGALGHMGIQFAWLLRHGFRLRPTLARSTEGLAQVARLVGPRLASQVVGQSNLIVMTNLASRAGEGSISALYYGQHLVMLPHGILALSLSTVIFPKMARQFGLGNMEQLRQTLLQAIRPLIFLTLPAAVVLLTFRESIIQVLLQYGSFTAESTVMVSEVVAWFAVGLLARSVIEPLTRAFYAMHDTRTPLLVSAISVTMNVPLSWFLLDRMGFSGLALSISIASTLRMLALLLLLSRRTGGLVRGVVLSCRQMLLPVVLLALAGAVLAQPVARATDPALGRDAWGYAVFLVAMLALGAGYLGVAYVARVPEAAMIVGKVGRRLGVARGPSR
jgi:putative peptidoglycan lipid II flippase